MSDPKSSAAQPLQARSPKTPAQQRSRDRLDAIVKAATGLILESGADALKMSDIAKAAGISIGSLYQYFPDKSAVMRHLVEQFSIAGRECVRDELAEVTTRKTLQAATLRVVDKYYEMFRAEPVMVDVIAGAQADRSLQAIDIEDGQVHAAMFAEAMARTMPNLSASARLTEATLLVHMLNAAVRLAISVPPKEGVALIAAFKDKIVKSYI